MINLKTADELYDHVMKVERKIKRRMDALTVTEWLAHGDNYGVKYKLETVTFGGPVKVIKGAAQ